MSSRRSLLDTSPVSQQTHLEDLVCALVQVIGLGLAIAGIAVLITLAALEGDAWHIVSVSIYGATLVIVYLSSTIYHVTWSNEPKRIFKVLDHANIHLLIAGTYTPFMLVTLKGGWGWSIFGVIWGLSLVGYLLKVVFRDRYGSVSVILYLSMGWLITMAAGPLMGKLPWDGLAWLLTGGVIYSLGVIFFLLDRLRFHHAVWQLFVLGGSACFYIAILLYVLP
ncbi:MAG: hemolysin III family protein [Candidatus Lambdaproteobacteria bacterium]|nr:hemolysin III family protein [Candidatus Lambdaproteobacteria bacterium]